MKNWNWTRSKGVRENSFWAQAGPRAAAEDSQGLHDAMAPILFRNLEGNIIDLTKGPSMGLRVKSHAICIPHFKTRACISSSYSIVFHSSLFHWLPFGYTPDSLIFPCPKWGGRFAHYLTVGTCVDRRLQASSTRGHGMFLVTPGALFHLQYSHRKWSTAVSHPIYLFVLIHMVVSYFDCIFFCVRVRQSFWPITCPSWWTTRIL